MKKNNIISIAIGMIAIMFVAGAILVPVLEVHAVTVSSVVGPNDITVPFGTTISGIPFPTTVVAIMTDASTQNLPVAWQPISYNGNVAGTYGFSGEVTMPGGAVVQATFLDVIVSPALNVISVATLSDINVANGTALGSVNLPTSVGITLSDNSTASASVSWNGGTPTYNGNASGTYAFTGTLTVPTGDTNTNNLAAAVNVIVAAPVVATPNITAVTTLSDINVANGTTLGSVGLPAAVGVNLSNGATTTALVSWNGGTPTYDGSTAQTYAFIGTLTAPSGTTNTNSLTASVNVIVAAPVIVTPTSTPTSTTPLNISSVATLSDINVANGTTIGSIGLPTTISIGLSDGSDTTTAIAWDGGTPAYDSTTSGTYAFAGTLTVPTGDTNTNNLAAAVNVIVAAPVIVTPTSTPSSTPTLSNDDTLSALNVDGTGVAGFDPATLSYSVVLPSGTTVVPTVTAIANNINATAIVTAASGLPGTSTVLVTAQDGVTSQTYSVAFTVATPVIVTPTSTPTSTTTTSGGGGGGGNVGVAYGATSAQTETSGGDLPTTPTDASTSTATSTTGVVLGASTTATTSLTTAPNSSTTCGIYLTNYLGFGMKNDPSQVDKLQAFLAENLGLNLPVTGFFGSATLTAVKNFQLKYTADILAPWFPGTTPTAADATGYAYKLTIWKINMLVCPSLDLPAPTVK